MLKKRMSSKIYFGWWMNLVMGITSGLGGGFVWAGASVLFKPLAAELGLSRAATSIATSISGLGGGILSPITGMLADKFGSKWLILGGTFLLSIGLIWMYFINSAWAYYIAWGVIISSGFNLGLMIAQDKVLTDWFIRKRGLVFGTRFAILGILSAAAVPVISWLVTSYGWRTACLTWAVIMLASIPLSSYFVRRHRPEYYGLLPDGAEYDSGAEANIDAMVDRGMEYASGFQETEFTFRQALRTPSYWMLVISWCGFGLLFGPINLHCIPLLTDMGISPGVAAFMMSVMNLVNTPARFVGGILSDRISKEHLHYLMVVSFLLQGFGIVILLLSQGKIAMLYLSLILLGVGSGIFIPLSITIRARYFGRKAYGSIQGTSQLFSVPVTILAPVYAGWVYDVTGSYADAFKVFVGIAAAMVILMLFLRPPKPSAEATSLHKFM